MKTYKHRAETTEDKVNPRRYLTVWAQSALVACNKQGPRSTGMERLQRILKDREGETDDGENNNSAALVKRLVKLIGLPRGTTAAHDAQYYADSSTGETIIELAPSGYIETPDPTTTVLGPTQDKANHSIERYADRIILALGLRDDYQPEDTRSNWGAFQTAAQPIYSPKQRTTLSGQRDERETAEYVDDTNRNLVPHVQYKRLEKVGEKLGREDYNTWLENIQRAPRRLRTDCREYGVSAQPTDAYLVETHFQDSNGKWHRYHVWQHTETKPLNRIPLQGHTLKRTELKEKTAHTVSAIDFATFGWIGDNSAPVEGWGTEYKGESA